MAEEPDQAEQSSPETEPVQNPEARPAPRKRPKVPLEERERQLAPRPSFWPPLLAVTLVISFIGIMTSPIILILGAILTVGTLIGWVLEKH